MVTTFPTFDAAIRAHEKWMQRIVLVDDRPIPCTDVSITLDADQGPGTCTLVIEAPMPDFVQLGSVVEVQEGYPGVTARAFHGRIPGRSPEIGDRGKWATLTARGWLSLLDDPHPVAITFQGPILLKEIVRAIYALRSVPYSLVDDITWADGSPVMLGIDPEHNGGKAIIPKKTGLRMWVDQALALPGYQQYDTGSGMLRVSRMVGIPGGTPAVSITEGELGYSIGHPDTLDGMVTYVDMEGARKQSSDGVSEGPIRSIPASVVLDPRLAPLGYRSQDFSSELLVTLEMADYARNIKEIALGAPQEDVIATIDLAPHLNIGEEMAVTSPTTGATGSYWITGVSHKDAATSLKTTTLRGTRGSGAALPAGQDCISKDLWLPAVHLGDEYISWYAVPSPSPSGVFEVPFTVPDDYSSLKLTGRGHGCNSFMIGGKNADSTVSRFEIWQGGEKVSEGNLPVMDEDYTLRLHYWDPLHPEYWEPLDIPMSGSITAGMAILKIIAGVDTRLPVSTRKDDFEVKDLRIRACGVGSPVFIPLGGS